MSADAPLVPATVKAESLRRIAAATRAELRALQRVLAVQEDAADATCAEALRLAGRDRRDRAALLDAVLQLDAAHDEVAQFAPNDADDVLGDAGKLAVDRLCAAVAAAIDLAEQLRAAGGDQ
ncbi:MAG: hypothetical protein JNN13_04420 [Planctomycetes bacterium]|nr:hypothetical protein [Planctomycetota bacterium]